MAAFRTRPLEAVLPGASWQRCRTHFMRNLLTRVPKSAQGVVARQSAAGAEASRYETPLVGSASCHPVECRKLHAQPPSVLSTELVFESYALF